MKKITATILVAVLFATATQAQCKCGTATNWLSAEMKIGDRAVNKYKCGYQFTIKQTEKVVFANGGYNCIDASPLPCKAKYKVNIYISGGGLWRTIDPFNFSRESIEFPAIGAYRVEVLATCNGITCKSCTYYFKVV